MTNKERKIQKLYISTEEWCGKRLNREFHHSKPEKKLKRSLKIGCVDSHSLFHFYSWHGSQAVCASWKKASSSGNEWRKFSDSLWIYIRFGRRDSIFYERCGAGLFHLALRSFEKAEWLLERIDEDHPSRRFYRQPYHDERMTYPIEFFCKALFTVWKGGFPNEGEIEKCGPFGGVFRTWTDVPAFAEAIYALCDYHLSRTGDPPGREIYEFGFAPYDLLPVEILALEVVREQLGLEMPEVDHPLLKTPLIKNLPETLPEAHDELLDRVREAAKRQWEAEEADGWMEKADADARRRAGLPTGVVEAGAPVFSTNELTMKSGLFSKRYGLAVTLRFTEGETLDKHWPRLLKAIAEWRKKRGKRVDMLNVIFQADGESHPELYRAFADRVEADTELDAWAGELRDYTLSFEELDGTGGRDLIRERQPDGQYLFSEMKYTEME